MNYVYTLLVGIVLGAVAYALVVRKNPKVQADVSKAATQTQPVASAVVAEVSAESKKL